MPNQNNWNVSYSTISFLEKVLRGHSKVEDFTRTQDILFEIELENGTTHKVLLLNEYTLGVANIAKAIDEFGSVDFILTGSNWNAYTMEAKQYGLDNNIGIFIIDEYIGAINTKDPIKYVKKDHKGRPIYHTRKS